MYETDEGKPEILVNDQRAVNISEMSQNSHGGV
jgi:hypothetical protein